VVDAGWLGMEAQSVLRWWFRSELLLNGIYPPAGTAPTPYVGDATACVVADFSTALMVHGNGARLKGLLTKHLRRLLVQHAVDVPGKHLKVLFLMRDITVSYWEEAYAHYGNGGANTCALIVTLALFAPRIAAGLLCTRSRCGVKCGRRDCRRRPKALHWSLLQLVYS
jgi:hypothetical protein